MKKMILTLIAVVAMVLQANAMSYEQARREALFLTDKMAYELNLSDAQYEAAYEINLDYLMGVTGRHDVFGTYWERRNADLNYILYSWQWDLFRAATYFFRPLYWDAGYWHFRVYGRYPHRDYYYFGRPHFYASYRGGHSWHRNGGRSYYQHHHDVYRPHSHRDRHFGLRDGWNRGDYRSHRSGNSSTRITGRSGAGTHNHGLNRQDNPGRSINGGRDHQGGRNYGGGNHGNANQGGGHHDDGNHGNANQGGGNHGNGNMNAGSGRQTSPRTVNYQPARYSGGISSSAVHSSSAASASRSALGTSGSRGSSYSSSRGTSFSSSAPRSVSYGRSSSPSYSRGSSFSSSTRSTVAGSHASGASRSSMSSHSGGGSRSSASSHSGGGRSGGRSGGRR